MTRKLTYKDYYKMRPDEFKPGDEVAVKVVAVVGHGGDYAVYAGEPHWRDEMVARAGDKCPRAVGEALFPSVAEGRSVHSVPIPPTRSPRRQAGHWQAPS